MPVLHRNEKWAKKLYTGKPPTIEETMQMIDFYVRFCYGETPHTSLNRRTPYEVDLRGFIYVVITRQNVPKTGRKVQKGILGQLRSLNRIGACRIFE